MLRTAPKLTLTKITTEITLQELGLALQAEIKNIDPTHFSAYLDREEFIHTVCFIKESQKIKKALQQLIAYYVKIGDSVNKNKKLIELAAIGDFDDRWSIALQLAENKATKHYALAYIKEDFRENTRERNQEQCEFLQKLIQKESDDLYFNCCVKLVLFEFYRLKFPESLLDAFNWLYQVLTIIPTVPEKQDIISQIIKLIPSSESALQALYSESPIKLVNVSSILTRAINQLNGTHILQKKDRAFLYFLHSKILILLARDPKEKNEYLTEALEKVKAMEKELPDITLQAIQDLEKEGDEHYKTTCLTYLVSFTEKVTDARKLHEHCYRLSQNDTSIENKDEKKISNPGKIILVNTLKKAVSEAVTDEERKIHLSELIRLEDKESIPQLEEVECKLKYNNIKLQDVDDRITETIAYWQQILSKQPILAETMLKEMAVFWHELDSTKKHQSKLIKELATIFEKKSKEEKSREEKSPLYFIRLTAQEKLLFKVRAHDCHFIDAVLNQIGEKNPDLQYVAEIDKKLIVTNCASAIALSKKQQYGEAAQKCAEKFKSKEWWEISSRFADQLDAYYRMGNLIEESNSELALSYYDQVFEDWLRLRLTSLDYIFSVMNAALRIENISFQSAIKYSKFIFQHCTSSYFPDAVVNIIQFCIESVSRPDLLEYQEPLRELLNLFIQNKTEIYKNRFSLIELGAFAEKIKDKLSAIYFYAERKETKAIYAIADHSESSVKEKIAAYEALVKIDSYYDAIEQLIILKRSPSLSEVECQREVDDEMNLFYSTKNSGYNSINHIVHKARIYIEKALYYSSRFGSEKNLGNCIKVFFENYSDIIASQYTRIKNFLNVCESYFLNIRTKDPILEVEITLLRARNYFTLNLSDPRGWAIATDALKMQVSTADLLYLLRLQPDRFLRIMLFLEHIQHRNIKLEPLLTNLINVFKRNDIKEEKSSLKLIRFNSAEQMLIKLENQAPSVHSYIVSQLDEAQQADINLWIQSIQKLKKSGFTLEVSQRAEEGDLLAASIMQGNYYRRGGAFGPYNVKIDQAIYWYKIAGQLGHVGACLAVLELDKTNRYPIDYYETVFDLALESKMDKESFVIMETVLEKIRPVYFSFFLKLINFALTHSHDTQEKSKALTALLTYATKMELPLTFSSEELPIITKLYDFLRKSLTPLLDRYHFEREYALLTEPEIAAKELKQTTDTLLKTADQEKESFKRTHLFLSVAQHYFSQAKQQFSEELISEGVRSLTHGQVFDLPVPYFKQIFSRYEPILQREYTDPALHFYVMLFLSKSYIKLNKIPAAIDICKKAYEKILRDSSHVHAMGVTNLLKDIYTEHDSLRSSIRDVIIDHTKNIFSNELKTCSKTVGSIDYHPMRFSWFRYVMGLIQSKQNSLQPFVEFIISTLSVPFINLAKNYPIHFNLQNDIEIMIRYIDVHLSALRHVSSEKITPYKMELEDEIIKQLSLMDTACESKSISTTVIAMTKLNLATFYVQMADVTSTIEHKLIFQKKAIGYLISVDLAFISEKWFPQIDDIVDHIQEILADLSPLHKIKLGNVLCHTRKNIIAMILYLSAGHEQPELLTYIHEKEVFTQVCTQLIDNMDARDSTIIFTLLETILQRSYTINPESKTEKQYQHTPLITQWFNKFGNDVDPSLFANYIEKHGRLFSDEIKNQIIIPCIKKCWIKSNNQQLFKTCAKYFAGKETDFIYIIQTFIENLHLKIEKQWSFIIINRLRDQQSASPLAKKLFLYIDASSIKKKEPLELIQYKNKEDAIATFLLAKLYVERFEEKKERITFDKISEWMSTLTLIQHYTNYFLALIDNEKIMAVGMQQCISIETLNTCGKIVIDNYLHCIRLAKTLIQHLQDNEKNISKKSMLDAYLDELQIKLTIWEMKELSRCINILPQPAQPQPSAPLESELAESESTSLSSTNQLPRPLPSITQFSIMNNTIAVQSSLPPERKIERLS